jgi:hypothetical protein
VTASVPSISPTGGRLLRVLDAAKAAYLDLYRVFNDLPRVWAAALAINMGLSIPGLLMDGSTRNGVGVWIVSAPTAIASAFFLTPYLIAVHRLIILDEIAPSYILRPGEPRFKKFLLWSLILWAGITALAVPLLLLSAFPQLILALTGANVGLGVTFVGLGVTFIATGAIVFTGFWATVRLAILFPAIAVDAAGASWRNVMADTRGYAWRTFLILVLTSLPLVPVVIGTGLALGRGTVAGAMIDGAVGIVSSTLCVVVASRLYQRLGYHVNRSSAV